MYPELVVALHRSQEHLLDERLEHRRTRLEREGGRRPERRRGHVPRGVRTRR